MCLTLAISYMLAGVSTTKSYHRFFYIIFDKHISEWVDSLSRACESGQEAILTKPTNVFLLCFASCQHVFICYDRERTRAILHWMLLQQHYQIETRLWVWLANRSAEKWKGSVYRQINKPLDLSGQKGTVWNLSGGDKVPQTEGSHMLVSQAT